MRNYKLNYIDVTLILQLMFIRTYTFNFSHTGSLTYKNYVIELNCNWRV